jgi:hypothetical protein
LKTIDATGSLKSETAKYGRESQGTRTEKICASKNQQHVQKTDPSSRQRGRPTKKDRYCQTVINIGARHQDLLTEAGSKQSHARYT